MKKIHVFQDDNASYTFIVGTDDPIKAEAALRAQEDVWYGPLAERTSDIEKPIDFVLFSPATIYSRGEFVHFDKGGLPVGKGRISEQPGFICPIE